MSNTIKFSQHKNPQNQNPPQAHSGIGIASFVLSLILFPAWIILFFYAGYVQVSAQEYGANMYQEIAMIIGLFFFVLLAVNILSLLLGIVGCIQKKNKKLFAILGLVLSFLALALVMIIFILGLIAQNAI